VDTGTGGRRLPAAALRRDHRTDGPPRVHTDHGPSTGGNEGDHASQAHRVNAIFLIDGGLCGPAKPPNPGPDSPSSIEKIATLETG
jgi:hypothetical protein